MSLEVLVFALFAALALGSALVVVLHRNPVVSTMSLVVTLVALAALFVMLGAPFIAALQILIYTGAIVVLFLFVLMLLNVRREQDAPERGGRTLRGVALALVTLLVLQAGAVVLRYERTAAAGFDASTRRMAEVLFSPHFLYVFEATSVLILAALVGAVVLAKKEL